MDYPKIRELDGVYFRVERDGKWVNRCFTDLTEAEREEVMCDRSANWLKSLAKLMAMYLRDIGDNFDIVRENTEHDYD